MGHGEAQRSESKVHDLMPPADVQREGDELPVHLEADDPVVASEELDGRAFRFDEWRIDERRVAVLAGSTSKIMLVGILQVSSG